MKKVQKVLFVFALTALFISCQSGTDTKQILSNADTRKEIMNTIAHDSSMHHEMMTVMMDSKNGMMTGDHASMMKMMKDNPGMMNDMMEMCKHDTAMMGGMCKAMMANPQMMDMMKKMKDGGMDKMKMDNMKGMDTMQGMDHSKHH
jgi:hypothetical protein